MNRFVAIVKSDDGEPAAVPVETESSLEELAAMAEAFHAGGALAEPFLGLRGYRCRQSSLDVLRVQGSSLVLRMRDVQGCLRREKDPDGGPVRVFGFANPFLTVDEWFRRHRA